MQFDCRMEKLDCITIIVYTCVYIYVFYTSIQHTHAKGNSSLTKVLLEGDLAWPISTWQKVTSAYEIHNKRAKINNTGGRGRGQGENWEFKANCCGRQKSTLSSGGQDDTRHQLKDTHFDKCRRADEKEEGKDHNTRASAHTHTLTRSAPLNGIVWVRCGLSLWLRPGEIGWLDNAQHSHVACCILMKCLPGAVGASLGSTAQRNAAQRGTVRRKALMLRLEALINFSILRIWLPKICIWTARVSSQYTHTEYMPACLILCVCVAKHIFVC